MKDHKKATKDIRKQHSGCRLGPEQERLQKIKGISAFGGWRGWHVADKRGCGPIVHVALSIRPLK
jgi:hypothetical protein